MKCAYSRSIWTLLQAHQDHDSTFPPNNIGDDAPITLPKNQKTLCCRSACKRLCVLAVENFNSCTFTLALPVGIVQVWNSSTDLSRPTLGSWMKLCPLRQLGGSSPVQTCLRHSMIVCAHNELRHVWQTLPVTNVQLSVRCMTSIYGNKRCSKSQ